MAFSSGSIEARSKIAVTMTINEVVARPDNPDSDYDNFDIKTTPTRGSRMAFPNLLAREEQFVDGFDPDSYINYTANPMLEEVRPGKTRTVGETLKLVYCMNIFPHVSYPKKGKRAGQAVAEQITTLMAIAGGTVEGVQKLGDYINGLRTAGKLGEGASGIATAINSFIKENGPAEMIAILKQGKNPDSMALTDRLEVSNWWGPVTAENVDSVAKYAAKCESKPEVGQRLQLGFEV